MGRQILDGLFKNNNTRQRRKEPMAKEKTAAAAFSTEGLLDQLLDILGSANGILGSIDEIEISIHEAKADGEPVSTGANDVIALLDSVRGNFENARETMLNRLDVLVGKSTPEPLPEEPEPEPEEEFEEEELEELEEG